MVESEGFKKRAEEQGAKAVVMTSAELSTLGDNENELEVTALRVGGIAVYVTEEGDLSRYELDHFDATRLRDWLSAWLNEKGSA